jgi:S1-C subfamily serine protease
MSDPQNPNPYESTDPADQTERHALPPAPGESGRFSPAPESRPDWAERAVWPSQTPQPSSERWYEPATPAPAAPVYAERPRRATGAGTVVGAALLAAALASGGTVVALNATGAFEQPAQPASSPVGATVSARQPVTIDESSAIIDVAAKAGPAVVKITTSGSATTEFGTIPETGVGSGVIYNPNGWILTNRHVVEGGNALSVELKDGRVFAGEVYGIDTLTDLAIVKIDGTDLPTASLGDSESLKVGQLVIAIGSPLGTYSNTVTSGIVSAKGRSIAAEGSTVPLNNLIQTDAAINPGNSGGPLLDAAGNVMGINTAIARDSTGIGFSIPINIAKPIMDQAVAGEQLARPYLGVRYEPVTVQLAKKNNLPVEHGALLRPGTAADGSQRPAVEPNGPADAAGLQDGDIIVSVDGQAIDDEHPLDATLSQHAPGRAVTVEVQRGNQTVTLQVMLGTRPADL